MRTAFLSLPHPPQTQTLVFDPLGLCLLPLLFPIPFITLIFINITLLWEPCFTVFSEMSPGIESYSFPLPCLLSPAFKLDVLVDRSALQDAVLHDKKKPPFFKDLSLGLSCDFLQTSRR